MALHWETDEASAHTVDDHQRENARLKHIIVDLEVALSPRPLFAKTLIIIQPTEEFLGQAHNIDKITHFMSRVRSFVAESIKVRTNLIYEEFHILEIVHKIGTYIRYFKESLIADTNQDE